MRIPLVSLFSSGRQSPGKKRPFAPDVLAKDPLPASMLRSGHDGEQIVECGPGWMALDPSDPLIFASFRQDGKESFCVVLACDPARDSLVLLPLHHDETPLSVLGDPDRRSRLRAEVAASSSNASSVERIELSLTESMDKGLLGVPIPTPRRILAVTTNFPSHLRHDLRIRDDATLRAISQTRPRLFQKHPLLPAPGTNAGKAPFTGVIGPYDAIRYPTRIDLPPDEQGRIEKAETMLDYEVEVGAVLGRTLDRGAARDATDEELMASIAGYLLASDVKARNPQVFGRAMERRRRSFGENPYLTADRDIDYAVGSWDRETCAWWGHASSWGDYSALGPFFVPAEGSVLPPRALVCARSYAEPDHRDRPVPKGRVPGVYYLSQCDACTYRDGHPDSLLWSVPDMLRSALAPDSCLDLGGDTPRLDPGDVICLGTPGGVVLTAGNRSLYRFLDRVLFWWDSRAWHDAFFAGKDSLYLRQGDGLLLWAEGLGLQKHRVVSQDE